MHNFFLSLSFIVSVQVRIFPLNVRNIIIYVARWWEKCLSEHSLIKHTCSWRDKHIVLWTLNRQAKIKNIFIKQQYFYAYQTFIIILISTTSLHFSHWISPWLRAMLSYFDFPWHNCYQANISLMSCNRLISPYYFVKSGTVAIINYSESTFM